MLIRHFITKRVPQAAMGMLLTLTGGLSAPMQVQTSISIMTVVVAGSAFLPASAATAALPGGTVELSPAPPNLTQAVPPNIMLTFDDSGSMQANHLSDFPPYTTNNNGSQKAGLPTFAGGPWRCANVIDADHLTAGDGTMRALAMNGVYYNPNITYVVPAYADGTNFPAADPTLTNVWVDGLVVNRPPTGATLATTAYNNNPDLDLPASNSVTDLTGMLTTTTTSTVVWYSAFAKTAAGASSCPGGADSGSCTKYSTTAKSGGKYYYYFVPNAATLYNGAAKVCPAGSPSGCTSYNSSTIPYYYVWSITTTTTTTSPDNRWLCGNGSNNGSGNGGGYMWTGASPMDGLSHTLSDNTTVVYPNGGPYYYRLKTGVTVNLNKFGVPASGADLTTLYTMGNWEAVPVPTTQYQNFANWYAYYRTRNQMARSSLSQVFGTGALAVNQVAGTTTTGFGSTIRMAWQNLNSGTYNLPTGSIISSLIDTANCTTTKTTSPIVSSSGAQTPTNVTTAPDCYRSAFFNWLYQVPAGGGTPTRTPMDAAGKFFSRGGSSDKTHDQNLKDPYWQAAVSTTNPDGTVTVTPGAELYCRQNYHMLVTDGLWNGGKNGPLRKNLTLAPSGSTLTLPDGTVVPDTATAGVTSVYAPVLDGGDTGYASLSDVAFHYWATNLRPDLYIPLSQQFVTPYMPDQVTGVVSSGTMSGSSVLTSNVNDEVYFNPNNDPASWPHMSEYLVGLGVSGQLNFSTDTDCASSDSSDACPLRKGVSNSSGVAGWPTPDGSGSGIPANIDDTWHAALAGRGEFFSAGNPQDLVTQLTKILSNIAARNVPAATSAISATVLTSGTLGFSTGYNSADWSGVLDAVNVNLDGTAGILAWHAADLLTAKSPSSRVILSSTLATDGSFAGGWEFSSTNVSSALDAAGRTTLMTPASTNTTLDTLLTRVDWLRGSKTSENDGSMRQRTSMLGAIIRSQAVYVSYPADGYRNNWPLLADGVTAAPETLATTTPTAGTANVSYEQFASDQALRKPVVYVAANDGMLHAFDASQNTDGSNVKDGSGNLVSGQELWAYVPRSAYSNLGNLTLRNGFSFAPTVDATPVTRDVFFDAATTTPAKTAVGWHTILVGGLGQGGRGVYALDVTDPDPSHATGVNAANVTSKVLWEFNAGMPAVAAGNPADLGYTYGQPNISRLATGKWVVLVPGGYFPDCGQSDQPANCSANNASPKSGSPAVNFSSLFVLDAQTGALIRELKTPTNITGVSSYGLSSPVLGDYNNDQIDDVAFAGDLSGNLWRYDLTNANPTSWSVSLAYKPTTQGSQPITSMPRLFPDPVTNRFMVVFGTGKYLGSHDNITTGATQAVYGIRDTGVMVAGVTNLVQQTLNEVAGTGANAGNTIIGLTSYPVPSSYNGWYFTLIAGGERVVVTPSALFDTNRAIITTLIPNNSNGCSSNNSGSLLVIDATTGGAGDGLSIGPSSWSSGGVTFKAVGAIVTNPATGGTVPVATSIGGGKLIFPGVNMNGGGTITGDDAIWRRRSWRELNNDQ
ncbi:MAG: PilC/PilY family type IV pilus protein [Rhodanobacter sp.]